MLILFTSADSTFQNGYQTMVSRYQSEEFQEKITQFIDSLEEVGVSFSL
jgi:hypothetical protein